MVRKSLGWIVILGMLLVSTASVGAAGATQHFGPFASVGGDGGTCGNDWATDTANRDFMVQQNTDGAFTVREEFKNGTFVTNAGASPGGCEADNHHGSTVLAGITGTFHGEEEGAVTGGTYNPNGCSTVGADCTTTAGFIAATFPGGTFSAATYEFHYAAGGQGLIVHEWKESFKKGDTAEQDTGDIANT
jgi:hypothetical protein